MLKIIYELTICHSLDDYVLQTDFLSRTKGENYWHLFVHCVLYSLPFTLLFGFEPISAFFLTTTHFIVDILKAKYKKINYIEDQLLHVITIVIYLFILHERGIFYIP